MCRFVCCPWVLQQSNNTHVRLTGDYKLAVDVNGSLSLCFSPVIDC